MWTFLEIEKKALKNAIKNIVWDIYAFGSRLNPKVKWWDIDIVIINKSKDSNLQVSMKVEKEFFKICEEKIDVVVLPEKMSDEQSSFFNIIKKVPIWQIL